MLKTMVISAFPACGKSWLAKNISSFGKDKPYTALELDSSRYDKSDPLWVEEYARDIWDALGDYDFILVSQQDAFLEELHKLGIPFVVVAPNNAEWSSTLERQLIKQQWFGRFLLRDNSHIKDFLSWIEKLEFNYDDWTSIASLTAHSPVSFFLLNQNMYLSDIIDDLYCRKEHYAEYDATKADTAFF